MLTIKLKVQGHTLGPHVMPWLGALVSDKIKGDRKHVADGNREGNLYYEDGATAAGYALLTHDRDAFAFQNEVWRYFLATVHDDGYLDSELSRGSRALIYHNRALSMLLALREIRHALGIPETTEDRVKLKSLSDLVGHSICYPEDMAVRPRYESGADGRLGVSRSTGLWYRFHEPRLAKLRHQNDQSRRSERRWWPE